MWIIDFGLDMSEREAALYEAPFEYVRRHVRPYRIDGQCRACCRARWWFTTNARPEHASGPGGLTPLHRHDPRSRSTGSSCGSRRNAARHDSSSFARDDDYTFGVLHSRVHELWARATRQPDSRGRVGFRYTPTTCFETFPFPDPTPEQRERVGEAARRLVELRDGWLNPPGLDPADLAKRTLTNLYNQRPTWLANAHADLDAAVFAAYGWPANLTDTEILERLLALNLVRAGTR